MSTQDISDSGESQVSDPSKRRTLKRIAAATGAAGATAFGATQTPRFSPVGRAQAAVPLLLAGFVGMGAGASIVAGAAHFLGSDEHEGYAELQRLSFWTEVLQEAASRNATAMQTTTFVNDFADFAESDFYNQAALSALTAIEDNGATQQEAIDAGMSGVYGKAANSQEGLIEEFHVYARVLENAMKDIAIIDGIDSSDQMIYNLNSSDTKFAAESVADTSVEYTLADGRTIQRNTVDFTFAKHSTASQTQPLILSSTSNDETYAFDHMSVSGDAGQLSSNQLDREFFVGDWPQSEYDDLPDEEKDQIEPPSDDVATANPRIFSWVLWLDTLQSLDDLLTSIESQIETWIGNIYEDLVNGDLSSEDVLTAGMMAEAAADQQAFTHAGAHLEALGLPTAQQAVTLEFPNRTDENGDPEQARGNLYAHPMPSGGFAVGDSVDPSTLESNFWWSFEDEASKSEMEAIDPERAEQMESGETEIVVDVIELTEPFDIVQAWEYNEAEDAVVETDGIDWTQTTTTEPPADYDELQTMNEELSSMERKIEELRKELATNDDDGGFQFPAIFGPDGFLPDPPFFLIGLAALAYVVFGRGDG